MKGNKSFISRAMKSQDYQGDIEERGKVLRILNTRFLLNPLLDETIFISKKTGRMGQPSSRSKEDLLDHWWPHNPDLYIKHKKIAIEIDGSVHWQNSRAQRRTNERNEHYSMAGITLVWLTKETVLKCTDEELEIVLREKLGL